MFMDEMDGNIAAGSSRLASGVVCSRAHAERAIFSA
jgi:hypothetical protein